MLVYVTEPGTWVSHCHIRPHAENDQGLFGMATALVVKERVTLGPIGSIRVVA